jgi:hypothetical protein
VSDGSDEEALVEEDFVDVFDEGEGPFATPLVAGLREILICLICSPETPA